MADDRDCNCDEMADDGESEWVCPYHGKMKWSIAEGMPVKDV